MSDSDNPSGSLLDSLMRLTGQVAGGTMELARSSATLTAMFGENWLRSALLNRLEPERLEAMADAGHFLRDARETAGISLKDLSESLGLSDKSILEDVESGETIMPLELVLRTASLVARHDPIPFLIKFMRTYNPQLEKTLESWGVLALPKQYERERRFLNLYRQHDNLRGLNDDEFERFIHYMKSSTDLVLEVMLKEKAAYGSRRASPADKDKDKDKDKGKAGSAAKAKPRRKSTTGARRTKSTTRKRPAASKSRSS